MNAVVTTDTENVIVDFNDLANNIDIPTSGIWHKNIIGSIQNLGTQIQIEFSISKKDWYISRTTDNVNGTVLIDTIDGATPTSNLDLYEKIVYAIKGVIL